MIGIVIVSHSRNLANGLKEMADEMTEKPVPIAVSAGMDDGGLGTDALSIKAAIEELYSDDGVIVFADIGSARLNAETAIDLLGKEQIHLCDAPLVEGVLTASVQAAIGKSFLAVIDDVESTNMSKKPKSSFSVPQGISRQFIIQNPLGLHARPAARFVQAMSKHDGAIALRNITKDGEFGNAKSIHTVVTSEIVQNDTLEIIAEPQIAEAVFADIERLSWNSFGEGSTNLVIPSRGNSQNARILDELPVAITGVLQGVTVSKGYAHGCLTQVRNSLPKIERKTIVDDDQEVKRFHNALEQTKSKTLEMLENAKDTMSDYDRKIFDAHSLLIQDPVLIEKTMQKIHSEKICAEAAWNDVITDAVEAYKHMKSDLLKARADDLIDVGQSVLSVLLGGEIKRIEASKPTVLAFENLRPSDILSLDTTNILGICVAGGGKTSHAGILASALSVPVIFALGEELLSISDNTEVLLDGQNARLQIEPSLSQVEHLKEKQQSWAKRMAKADKFKLELAKTSDGHRVRVAANLASLQELSLVQNSGAEEIGLFRTEFLFMNRDTAPDEDEQFSTYKTVVEAMKGYPVTIRTMDIGGDKPVPYLDRPKEANPNLGWRGLRHSLDEKELFQTQLAAILRAGAFGKIRIMFPLVSTLEELADAQELLEITKNKLIQKEVDFDENCEVGIMIEVPAAAELADSFAKHVDFFSIGTNDLTQYTMASDRANTKLKYLFDPFQPAVLRTISRVIKAAHDNDIWIGMCGAMAGDLEASSILVGMGLDEFSMNASDIPEFKLACNKLSLDTCKKLADEILEMETVHEIHERLKHNSL